jgi:hypothetical protein
VSERVVARRGDLETREFRPALAAALREWHERCGAELVASWGTMLQFVVNRPPASGQDAWDVGQQILSLACSHQDPAWHLALALERTRTWFLHCRP